VPRSNRTRRRGLVLVTQNRRTPRYPATPKVTLPTPDARVRELQLMAYRSVGGGDRDVLLVRAGVAALDSIFQGEEGLFDRTRARAQRSTRLLREKPFLALKNRIESCYARANEQYIAVAATDRPVCH